MNKLFKINEKDNVAVALCDLKKGYTENGVTLSRDVPFGHKVLLEDVKAEQDIIKYGYPIGCAKENIAAGEYVHAHNLKTKLGKGQVSYSYTGDSCKYTPRLTDLTFSGYERENGEVGIRNEIWIIPTVGCVNTLCEA